MTKHPHTTVDQLIIQVPGVRRISAYHSTTLLRSNPAVVVPAGDLCLVPDAPRMRVACRCLLWRMTSRIEQ